MTHVYCPLTRPGEEAEGCGHVFEMLPAPGGGDDGWHVECPSCGLTFEPCDCSTVVVGALWPWAPDSDASLPWVERCDDCNTFNTDTDAAFAVARAIGSRVMYAALDVNDRGLEGLRPFVLPVGYQYSGSAPATLAMSEEEELRAIQLACGGTQLDALVNGRARSTLVRRRIAAGWSHGRIAAAMGVDRSRIGPMAQAFTDEPEGGGSS